MTQAQQPKALQRAGAVALRLACEGDEQAAETIRAMNARIATLQAENEQLRGSLEAQRLITDRAIAIAKQLEAQAQPAREPLDPMHPPGLTSVNAILSFNHGWRACQLAHGITGGSDGGS